MDLYQRQGPRALARLAEALPLLKKSFLMSLHIISGQIFDLRARAALQVAAQGGPEVEARLRQVEADARDMERQGLAHMRARADLLRAGVAAVKGRAGEAVERYRRAAEKLEELGLGLYAASARLRLGQWLGGEEGRALQEAARQWMQGQGVLSPESMAEIFAPATRGP
jgi:hypothetical protein